MIEYIYIFKSHSFERLVNTCDKILPAAEVSVRTRPHIVARFCGNDHFIAVWSEMFFQYSAEVYFGAAGLRSVIVGKVEMCDPVIKSGKAHLLHVGIDTCVPEIMPESERYGRQHQTAAAASEIFHFFIALFIC